MPTKNTAYRVTFPIYDNTGNLVSGAAGLDSEVSIDGGTFADCTNEATEIATASGIYYLDLTSGEMNGDTIAILVKTSTVDARTTVLVFYPNTLSVAQIGTNAVSLSAAAIQSIWDALTSALTTAGSIGKRLVDFVTTLVYVAPDNTSVAAIKTQTDKLTFDGSNFIKSDPQTLANSGDFNATQKASITTAVPTAAAIAVATRDVNNTSPAANSLGAAINDRATPGDVPTADDNALALLKKDFTGITGEPTFSALNALRSTRNDWSTAAVAGKRRVFKEDGTTTAFDQTVATDPTAEPIIGASTP